MFVCRIACVIAYTYYVPSIFCHACLHIVCMSYCMCNCIYLLSLAYFAMHVCILFAHCIACVIARKTANTILANFCNACLHIVWRSCCMYNCMSYCMYNGRNVPSIFCTACLHVLMHVLLRIYHDIYVLAYFKRNDSMCCLIGVLHALYRLYVPFTLSKIYGCMFVVLCIW